MMHAVFNSIVPDYEGIRVFEANKQIIRDMRNNTGALAGVEEAAE